MGVLIIIILILFLLSKEAFQKHEADEFSTWYNNVYKPQHPSNSNSHISDDVERALKVYKDIKK